MSVSPEKRKRYFQETAIALRREGFRIEPSVGGRLGVWLDDHPICKVDQIGGITYRSDNIPTPEYVAAKDKAYRMRFEDGGILVGHGYVAQHADLKQVYNTLTLVPKKPDYAFRLLIGRYPFDTNDQPDKLVPLALPATPDELADALNACGAASWDEVVFQAEDSAVPHILEELDCDGIEEINELAQAIQYRAKRSELTKLKAVLHASDCHSIHAATYIAENLDDYLYEPDQRTPEEVATEELCFIVDEQSLPLLKKHVDLFYYGRDIIAEANAMMTSYGLVQRRDGELLQSIDETPSQGGIWGEDLRIRVIDGAVVITADDESDAEPSETMQAVSKHIFEAAVSLTRASDLLYDGDADA